MNSSAIIVLVTTGSEQQAITIAEELVQQELAASVNILPTMRSIYRFNGKIFDDEENLLIIKSTEARFEEICKVTRQLHTYEIPEILSFNVDKGEAKFLRWLLSSTRTESAN